MLTALVSLSLRYKLLVLIVFATVVGFGIRAFELVPVDAFPDLTPVQVNIYTESPGLDLYREPRARGRGCRDAPEHAG